MDTPPPAADLTLSDWGIIVAILATVAAGMVWLWKAVVRRFLLWSHRVFSDATLRAELEDIRDSKRAVQTLGRQCAQMMGDIGEMQPAVKLIPVIDERSKATVATMERIEQMLMDMALQNRIDMGRTK